MQKISEPKLLEKKSIELKIEVIKMLDKADSGHVGGAFSAADILTALYYNHLNIDPSNPEWEKRDYMLISNGHICPIWYAILADLGYFAKEELDSFRQINSLLQGHPVKSIPGVENSSGPLGHGLSQAVGIALGLKRDGKPNKVFCLTSDGEHQEGQTYEAAMSASKWDLNNLVVIVDNNTIQIEGKINEIMPLGNLRERYDELDWLVMEINGNDFNQILQALEITKKATRPTAIISHSIAGEGVDFMQNNPDFHDWKEEGGVVEKALKQLQTQLDALNN